MPAWFLGYEWSGDTPGARLRQVRVTKNMTIRDLSSQAGLCAYVISCIENDKHKAALPTLRKLSEALNVPVAFLGCFESLPEKTLGQRITKARFFHGLMKNELAKLLDVNVKNLREWEQDKHCPSGKYLTALKRYLAIIKNDPG